MKNGMFTPEERERLSRLGAVLEARARQIVYSPEFKKECMRRYRAGERPGVIFASAGLPASLIGHKRIEHAVHHWKHPRNKEASAPRRRPACAMSRASGPLKDEKRRTVERRREAEKLKDRPKRHKAQVKKREERSIAPRGRHPRHCVSRSSRTSGRPTRRST